MYPATSLLLICNDGQFQIITYTRDDINLLQTINQQCIYLEPYADSTLDFVAVKLHKAKRPYGRIVLIKTYHGSPSKRKTNLIHPSLFETLGRFSSCHSLSKTSHCAEISGDLWLEIKI